MNYIEPAAAREMDGLRLALTAHAPAPYSLSARAILDHHGVPYVPVLQVGGGPNEDLVTWTGHRNAPVAVYNDEAPRVGWLEILNLAERLGSGPSLVPSDIDDRMLMVALSNELIGENGFIWDLRIVMLGLGGPEQAAGARVRNPMYDQYGYSEEAVARGVDRAGAVLDRLTAQLLAQRDAGRQYIVGDALSAVDIYWVYFSQAVGTFPEAVCAMPKGMRTVYDAVGEMLGERDPILVEQRDRVLAEHGLPMDF
ncbi:MAG: hypothetical protein F4X36_14465 [Gammaproteobacteria bacterium]|nr:hypothetical protein [Gammaproteobacteria bacterium]